MEPVPGSADADGGPAGAARTKCRGLSPKEHSVARVPWAMVPTRTERCTRSRPLWASHICSPYGPGPKGLDSVRPGTEHLSTSTKAAPPRGGPRGITSRPNSCLIASHAASMVSLDTASSHSRLLPPPLLSLLSPTTSPALVTSAWGGQSENCNPGWTAEPLKSRRFVAAPAQEGRERTNGQWDARRRT